jgi:uncharacterized protein
LIRKPMRTRTLYRPVGPAELELIAGSGWREFPPRLPEQPIFYLVLSEEYAAQIAERWNVRESGSGYVTEFDVDADYVAKFEVQKVGGREHLELWVPAEELEAFNRHIVGTIRVVREFGGAPKAIADLAVLLRSLEPVLHAGVFAYCVVPTGTDISGLSPVATVAEAEGLTLVLREEQAREAGLAVLLRAARITLAVHSDLHAVGLTAAVAGALGRAGVSCNVVAGAFHDHLFVPFESADLALTALRALQQESSA